MPFSCLKSFLTIIFFCRLIKAVRGNLWTSAEIRGHPRTSKGGHTTTKVLGEQEAQEWVEEKRRKDRERKRKKRAEYV